MTDEYKTNEPGIISHTAKFSEEPIYAPYFWDLALMGEADEDNGTVYTFHVTDKDRAKFPELAGAKRIHLAETEDGFAYTTTEWK